MIEIGFTTTISQDFWKSIPAEPYMDIQLGYHNGLLHPLLIKKKSKYFQPSIFQMIGDEYEKWIKIADQATERKCYQKTCKPKDC